MNVEVESSVMTAEMELYFGSMEGERRTCSIIFCEQSVSQNFEYKLSCVEEITPRLRLDVVAHAPARSSLLCSSLLSASKLALNPAPLPSRGFILRDCLAFVHWVDQQAVRLQQSSSTRRKKWGIDIYWTFKKSLLTSCDGTNIHVQ